MPASWCEPCRRSFASPRARDQHIANSSRHPRCDECYRRFLDDDVLRQHFDDEHRDYMTDDEDEYYQAAGLAPPFMARLMEVVDHEWGARVGSPEPAPERDAVAEFQQELQRMQEMDWYDHDEIIHYAHGDPDWDEEIEDEDEDDPVELMVDDYGEEQERFNFEEANYQLQLQAEAELEDARFHALGLGARWVGHDFVPAPAPPHEVHNRPSSVLRQVFAEGSDASSDPPAANLKLPNCPLCLDNLKLTTSTACGHVFCTPCIVEALKARRECPVCRKDAAPTDLRRLFLTSS
ncbi:hypothetical protein SISNIDRAFT_449564 [Sistotremastrum niveocremeum HHB9708]|uniref:RING-type domain-containing protein n=2 Tax=Sistotremastraceae TaxID=3402574 RepID=A0A164ZQB7_9AGAM|nr:hypothetical protein SISNIDRAFT_449564 [Sistotremastrum niveocremeum HHB9708]KZT36838.1 hypothetical protein SISSUDRAFT_1049362 [Sistotremastrum suecicum HHB10207 ss-3]